MSRFIYVFSLFSLFLLGCGRKFNSGVQSPTASQSQAPAFPTYPARPSSAPNITVCPQNGVTSGVDVSEYDPGTQWTVFRNSGSRFAFIKATEGTDIKNQIFNSEWTAALSAGVIRGAYHFFHPGEDPVAQAQFFLATVGTLTASDLPPVLDWEVTDGVSTAEQIKNALTWLQLVQAQTGRTPAVYVNPSFWNQLGNPQQFAKYPLYIANYNTTCPTVPPPWSTWTFWQSGIGAVPGLQSPYADIDVFNGPASAL